MCDALEHGSTHRHVTPSHSVMEQSTHRPVFEQSTHALGVVCAAMPSLSTTKPGPLIADAVPFPMPLVDNADSEFEDILEAVCYPTDMHMMLGDHRPASTEDCDTCEYSESLSRYYKKEIWLCKNPATA